MEAEEVDRQRRAIEREFVQAVEDENVELAYEIMEANLDLDLFERYINEEIK